MTQEADDVQGRLDRLSPRRRALFEALRADPGMELDLEATGSSHRLPETEVEQVLCRAWQSVLQLPAVGVDDDFFELGGDSISAVLIVAQAELAGVLFSTRDLFEVRTIAALAPLCRRGTPEPDRQAVPPSPADISGAGRSFPLTPLQRTILAHSDGGAGYVSQLSARMTGELSVEAIRHSWQAMADRHEALRVFVTTGSDGWRQSIAAHVDLVPDYADLRGEPDLPSALTALRRAQRTPFEMGPPPLTRVLVARTGERSWWLLWTHSHLILDGWSEQIIADEVLRLLSGQALPTELPAPDSLVPRLAGPDATDDPQALELWRDRLSGSEATLVGGPGPFPGIAAHCSRALQLPEAAEAALHALARDAGVTIAGCLLAAWAAAIAQFAGRPDVLLGVTANGRDAAAARAVGMFVDTYPLRALLDPARPFGLWARELHRRQQDWMPRTRTSLTAVRAAAGLPPQAPMFDSIIVVQNFPALVAPGSQYGGLTVHEIQAEVDEQFPLLLDVTIRDRMTLTLRWDPERIGSADIDGWLNWLSRFPEQIGVATPVADALSLIAEYRRSAADQVVRQAELSLRRAERSRVRR
jgi:nonribosomal peptide synthetase protein BlmV